MRSLSEWQPEHKLSWLAIRASLERAERYREGRKFDGTWMR